MKILFSVYKEDYDTGIAELKESVLVNTDWSVQKIDEFIALSDGFRAEIVIGENLSFFDYYCFFEDYSFLIERIKTIHNNDSELQSKRTPNVLRVSEFNPGSVGKPFYSNGESCYLYNLERFECGASSFEEIVYWASQHPLEMMFIGGLIYDFTKWAILKVLKLLGLKNVSVSRRPVILNVKRFYRNLSTIINVETKDCQITKIIRIKNGKFKVEVRTLTNRIFITKCYANGKIETLEEMVKSDKKSIPEYSV